MDGFFRGFNDELLKIAFDMNAALRAGGLPLAGGAALAGIAIYDLIRGNSYKTGITSDVVKGVSEGEQVGSRREVQKLMKDKPLDRKAVPVTTMNDVAKMLKDPQFNALQKSLLKEFAQSVIKKGTNAAVVQGKDKNYVIVPPKANKEIIAHEIGHLRDFASGAYKEPNFVERAFGAIWKPTYEKTTLGPERRAWMHAKGKGSLPGRAIGTYEKAFHKGRAVGTGSAAAFTIISALKEAMKAGRTSLGRG